MYALKPAVISDNKLCICASHFVSMICSSSWAFLHSSSAGAKLFPTFMKSAATLLLRRKPAARRFSPCKTHASTAAVWKQTQYIYSIYIYICFVLYNNNILNYIYNATGNKLYLRQNIDIILIIHLW